MTRYSSKYKSEYNKIIEGYLKDKEDESSSYTYEIKDRKNTYTFRTTIEIQYNSVHPTYSHETRNKKNRIENELICVE